MSEERINMLNAIGFNWTAPRHNAWNNQFEALKEYKSKYGDCNVNYDNENKQLANWVQNQRSRYNRSTLSEDRIEMLNSIGFVWSPIRHQSSTLKKTSEKKMENAIGNEICPEKEESEIRQSNEMKKTYDCVTPIRNEICSKRITR